MSPQAGECEEAEDVDKGGAMAPLACFPFCSLPLTREAGLSSPPHAQEARSGNPTNNPLWKVEKETDVLIK